jgi:hypothetical protein
LDLKGLGYLISTISVVLLGVVAWPAPSEPAWHGAVVVAGMALSILGMCVRYISHRQDRQDIRRAAYNKPPED